ncbi:MAG: murein L,D-transpeptidase [Clostridia bacterium]|nr:murein L,D-transpeptidase [Clostridia bacterium]
MLKRLVSILLLLAMTAALAPAFAEEAPDTAAYVDIENLIDPALLPVTWEEIMENTLNPDAVTEERVCRVERINQEGVTLAIDVKVAFPADGSVSWEVFSARVESAVTAAIQGIAVDAASLARVSAEALSRLSIGDPETLCLRSVSVTLPYYPTLKTGSSGAEAQRLQQRLIDLGFLEDTADGHFGDRTKVAVEELQEFVREQEMAAAAADEPSSEGLLVMSASAESVRTPATRVTGEADAKLQAYLYSDAIERAVRPLGSGDKGVAVRRIQRRLRFLGYTTGAIDGDYGGDTARAVRLFQRYNGMETTGNANEETQLRLFGNEPALARYAILKSGDSGSDVKTLQTRLRTGGFMSANVDGSYGSGTVNGVKALQQYLISSGTEYASYMDTPNGIADSLLLELFFSKSFPQQPQLIPGSGDKLNIVRLQRRLSMLEYYTGPLDGDYGGGTKTAVATFQKRHKLSQSGVLDGATASMLFSANAEKALKPYMIGISIKRQKVYIYAPDGNDEYTKLVRTMTCSTGKNNSTPRGTFTGGPTSEQWHCFKNFPNCWAQYAYYVTGDIMIHSVLFNAKNGKLTKSSVRNLGSPASHGYIRLSVEDAKWIWQHCPKGTKIIIK